MTCIVPLRRNDMTEQTLVSLIIPCYNHEKFLDDCLRSIINQTHNNIELLICDDCSPDRSYEILESYRAQLTARFARVEIMRNATNCGVTKNINRMLAMAKGKYIKILASDDAMAPDAIACMADYLDAHDDIDVVVSNGIKVSEDEQYPNFTPISAIYEQAPDFDLHGFFERVATNNPISAPAAMVRLSVYEEYGYYDEQVKVEDFEFWLRILKDQAVRFGFLDKQLLYYRLNANSMTSLTGNSDLAARRKRILFSELDSLKKFKDYLSPDSYAKIVTNRLMADQWLAVEYQLTDWERELKYYWRNFREKKDLPLKNKLSYAVFSCRQFIKKRIKRS